MIGWFSEGASDSDMPGSSYTSQSDQGEQTRESLDNLKASYKAVKNVEEKRKVNLYLIGICAILE